MKTPSRAHRRGGGFSTIQLLIVGLMVVMVLSAGWAIVREKTSVASEYHALAQADFFDTDAPVRDFYSCVEKTGGYEPGAPQACSHEGESFKRPAQFTPENVRNMEHVPEGARGSVQQLARKNFAICDDVPDTVSITRVLNVSDGFIYAATGCDEGHSVIMVPKGLAWKEVNLGQGGLTCKTAAEYKIPRALVYNTQVEGSGDCYEEDGSSRALPD